MLNTILIQAQNNLDNVLTQIATDIQTQMQGQNPFSEPTLPLSLQMCLKIIRSALQNQNMINQTMSIDNTALTTAIVALINSHPLGDTVKKNTADILSLQASNTTNQTNITSLQSISSTNSYDIIDLKDNVNNLTNVYQSIFSNLRYAKETTGLDSSLTKYPSNLLATLPSVTIMSDAMAISGLRASSSYINQSSSSSAGTIQNLINSYCIPVVGNDDVSVLFSGSNFSGQLKLIFNLNGDINKSIHSLNYGPGNALIDFLNNPPIQNTVTSGSNRTTLNNSGYIYATSDNHQMYVYRWNNQDVVIIAFDSTLFFIFNMNQILVMNKNICAYKNDGRNYNTMSTTPFGLGNNAQNMYGQNAFWDFGSIYQWYPSQIFSASSLTSLDSNKSQQTLYLTNGYKLTTLTPNCYYYSRPSPVNSLSLKVIYATNNKLVLIQIFDGQNAFMYMFN